MDKRFERSMGSLTGYRIITRIPCDPEQAVRSFLDRNCDENPAENDGIGVHPALTNEELKDFFSGER